MNSEQQTIRRSFLLPSSIATTRNDAEAREPVIGAWSSFKRPPGPLEKTSDEAGSCRSRFFVSDFSRPVRYAREVVSASAKIFPSMAALLRSRMRAVG
jgi:hypothetical protein